VLTQERAFAVDDVQQHLRIVAAHARKQREAEETRPIDWKTDGHSPTRKIGRVHRVPLGAFDLSQDRLGVTVECAASLGERDALGTTHHQLAVELLLQAREMMAERRLRDVQLLRGARQTAGLNDPNEIAKLTQVHERSVLVRTATHAWKPRLVDALPGAWQKGSVARRCRPVSARLRSARLAEASALYTSSGHR